MDNLDDELLLDEIGKLDGTFIPPKPKPTLTQLICDWCDHEGFNYAIQWRDDEELKMNGFGWNLRISKGKAHLNGGEPGNVADPAVFEDLKTKIAAREKEALGPILDSIDD
jgi:hypothetical protein